MSKVQVSLNHRNICLFKCPNNDYAISKIPELIKNNVPKRHRSAVTPVFKHDKGGQIVEIKFITKEFRDKVSSNFTAFLSPLCPVPKEV